MKISSTCPVESKQMRPTVPKMMSDRVAVTASVCVGSGIVGLAFVDHQPVEPAMATRASVARQFRAVVERVRLARVAERHAAVNDFGVEQAASARAVGQDRGHGTSLTLKVPLLRMMLRMMASMRSPS